MPSRETVRMATQGQTLEIVAAIVQTVPRGISFDRAQWLVGHKGEWTRKVGEILLDPTSPNVSIILRDWEKFYLDVFGREVDFSGIVVPVHQAGFDCLIVVAEGMTPNVTFSACRDRFPVWSCYDDLDKAVVKSDREPTQSYAIWVRDRTEADDKLKSISAIHLREQGVQGVTLLERLLWEL